MFYGQEDRTAIVLQVGDRVMDDAGDGTVKAIIKEKETEIPCGATIQWDVNEQSVDSEAQGETQATATHAVNIKKAYRDHTVFSASLE